MKKNSDFAPSVYALSMRETAKRLGSSLLTTKKLLDSGQLRSIRIGKRRRVSLSALTAFIEGSGVYPIDYGPSPAPKAKRRRAARKV